MCEYPDIADVSEGMDTYWNWAVAYGFVNTAEDGSLLPAATATRAELAQVLYVLNLAFGG